MAQLTATNATAGLPTLQFGYAVFTGTGGLKDATNPTNKLSGTYFGVCLWLWLRSLDTVNTYALISNGTRPPLRLPASAAGALRPSARWGG